MEMKAVLFKTKYALRRTEAQRKFRMLGKSQHLSLDEQIARGEQARRELVKFVCEHIPFYKRLYGAAGFEIGDIGADGWFESLPILTKAHLREHFDEIVNPELRRYLRISTTGGSTGTPTKTGYDARIVEETYSWRLQSWFGINPWEDHAYCWRDTRPTKKAKLINALIWWPTKHLKLDASVMTEADILDFLAKYNKLRPSLLQGYVGAISQVAKVVVEKNLKVWVPKCVWVTSAPISAVQRKLIEAAFHAPICDQYGSCEIRWIAQQCQCGDGLHVNTEHVHLEYVDGKNKPVSAGEYGRTLLTNLEDLVFPMLRYENGDRGRYLTRQCACGRTLPLIDSVKGRESESFVMPSGAIVNGETLTTIFDATPDLVISFRVVQHKDMSITVEYVPKSNDCIDKVENVVRCFAVTKLNDEVAVDCKVVQEIAQDRGKLRFVMRET